MDISTALPTFVVTLGEGFEASLLVGIILACLAKAGQTQLNRWVYQGIGAAIVAVSCWVCFSGKFCKGLTL